MLQNQTETAQESAPRKLSTVKGFSSRNPEVCSESALRNHIFKANEREGANGTIPGNGLIEAGAIIRVGRKVLIDDERFFAWIESHKVTGHEKSGEEDEKSEIRGASTKERSELANKAAAAKKGRIAPTPIELAGQA